MAETGHDVELAAMQSIMTALTPLDTEARGRVVAYVNQRLNIALGDATARGPAPEEQTPHHPVRSVETPKTGATQHANDIRTLAGLKQPSSAIEMTAVVAYYLKEAAPQDERKDEITADDLEKYFKQARFRLPKVIGQTLLNAKNAGYLDPGSQRGSFGLNPVGHNLVAHGLPAGADTAGGIARTRRRAPAAKKKRTSSGRQSTKKAKRSP